MEWTRWRTGKVSLAEMASWVAWSTWSYSEKGVFSDSRCSQRVRLLMSEEEGGTTVQTGSGAWVLDMV